jgi:hypothetical protein
LGISGSQAQTRAAFSFSDAAYQHYDPATEGYGSVDEWIATAEALCSGRGIYRATKQTGKRINPDLVTLNLTDSTISTWCRGNRYSTSSAIRSRRQSRRLFHILGLYSLVADAKMPFGNSKPPGGVTPSSFGVFTGRDGTFLVEGSSATGAFQVESCCLYTLLVVNGDSLCIFVAAPVKSFSRLSQKVQFRALQDFCYH